MGNENRKRIKVRIRTTPENVDTSCTEIAPVETEEIEAKRRGLTVDQLREIKQLEYEQKLECEEAERRGLTVNQLRELKHWEWEQAAERQRRVVEEHQQRDTYENWVQQANELKATYPQFNFSSELSNTEFKNLLKQGFSVRDAYESIHKISDTKNVNDISIPVSLEPNYSTVLDGKPPFVKVLVGTVFYWLIAFFGPSVLALVNGFFNILSPYKLEPGSLTYLITALLLQGGCFVLAANVFRYFADGESRTAFFINSGIAAVAMIGLFFASFYNGGNWAERISDIASVLCISYCAVKYPLFT